MGAAFLVLYLAACCCWCVCNMFGAAFVTIMRSLGLSFIQRIQVDLGLIGIGLVILSTAELHKSAPLCIVGVLCAILGAMSLFYGFVLDLTYGY
jgi:hypothetical protein